ncbi:MAG: histidine kinase dimerization/phospho-acceptor domain-containing protein [Sphingomicrobium sp.]
MRFDDRLATVLSQPVGSPHDRAVRWRQLVDLVARSGGLADRALLGRAIDLIRGDRSAIREPIRAAAARSIAGSPIPLALLTVFAADKLAVAAPLIASASLTGEALGDLRAAASPDVRRFLDSLSRPAQVEALIAPEPEPATPTELSPPPEFEPMPSISDVVARIERLRSSRETQLAQLTPPPVTPPPIADPAPRAPDYPVPALFRWECGAGGEIEWVEGAPRGPLIGRSIAVADADEGVDDCVESAFLIRAPFRDCLLELGDDGLMAGDWQISGAPAFAPGDGRFIGYRGIARRGLPEPEPLPPRPAGRLPSGHDALREMIHEIKTPLNAIIGFAEIIDGQYFGPAHSRYRERAAEIVTNARSLLEAAEDLDFVARLQSARLSASDGTDLAEFFPAFSESLSLRAAAMGIELRLDASGIGGICMLEPELTERLLRRFTDAILAASTAGEQLSLRVRRFDDRMAIGVTRPKATILAGKEELLDPEFTIGGADRALLGLGFSLRLINGLVEIAGGGLEIDAGQFTLSMPLRD